MKRPARRAVFITLCLVATSVAAETRYKCETREAVAYQYKPCPEGVQQTALEEPKPTDQEQGGEDMDGLVVSGFSVKTNQVQGEYQYFSMKVQVTNKTDQPREASLKYQAIDGGGYEVESHYLSGTVLPGRTETLTDTSLMKIAQFRRIKEWKLKK